MEAFSKQLVRLRSERGITQGELAQALGISNKTVSKWENGSTVPDLKMLVELSEYYHVSTDLLLGLRTEDESMEQRIKENLRGLALGDALERFADAIRASFSALFDSSLIASNRACSSDALFAQSSQKDRRYQISRDEMYQYFVNAEDLNLAVLHLKNRSDFAWLKTEKVQKRLANLFAVLSDVDVIRVLAWMHNAHCSESFTVGYMANVVSLPDWKTTEILEKLTEIGLCKKERAHLKSEEILLYTSRGDGGLLSILALAYAHIYHRSGFEYNYNVGCKMIGGEDA